MSDNSNEDELARIRNLVRSYAPGTFPIEPRYNEGGTMTTMSRQIIAAREDIRHMQRREEVLREYFNRLEGINSGNLVNFMNDLAGSPNAALPPRIPGDAEAFSNSMRDVVRAIVTPPRDLKDLPDLPRELHHRPAVAPSGGGGARAQASSTVASETTTTGPTTVHMAVPATSSPSITSLTPITRPTAVTNPPAVTSSTTIAIPAATAASTSSTDLATSSITDDSSALNRRGPFFHQRR